MNRAAERAQIGHVWLRSHFAPNVPPPYTESHVVAGTRRTEILGARRTERQRRAAGLVFYEYLIGTVLDVPDVATGNYVEALDPARQFTAARRNSPRSRSRISPSLSSICLAIPAGMSFT